MAENEETFLEKLAGGVKTLAESFKSFKNDTNDNFENLFTRVNKLEKAEQRRGAETS